MNSCKQHPLCKLLYKNTGLVRLKGFYRVYLGKRQGQKIWIVDGDRVFWKIYPAFVMGGNDQRYRFNPDNEVWIDNRSGIEEYRYTLAHELIERKLMRDRGWSYDRAHREGIKLEKSMRDADQLAAIRHELKLGGTLPKGVYRQFFGFRKGYKVWIVDGPMVRRELYGDFAMSGNGVKYPFIPKDEIWLDSAMTLEQVHYSLLHELAELKHFSGGGEEDKAYEAALCVQLDERERQAKLVSRHEARQGPVRYGTRERGVKPRH